LFALAVSLAALVLGQSYGEAYVDRISDHQGFFLVSTDDPAPTPQHRPRRTVLVLFDGLREDFARRMSSLQAFQDAGQCATTEVDTPTVSRPVYTAFSSGVPQARTGVRNNHTPEPAPVESVFEVARRAGLRVSVISEVDDWWKTLFPKGFSSLSHPARSVDYFSTADLQDLTLIHPLYIDEAGHHFGAASPQYQSEVARGDRELAALLARLDLTQDLVIITADHGHTDTGGHGGAAPEVSRVLTCFAGVGVVKERVPKQLRVRFVGPALSLLLGVSFPRHMQSEPGDDLDALLAMLDESRFSSSYLENRKAAVEKFRATQARALREWVGEPATWEHLEAVAFRPVLYRSAALVAFLLGLALFLGKRRGTGYVLGSLGYTTGLFTLASLVFVWLRGSFDMTSINLREEFIEAAMLSYGVVSLVGALVLFATLRPPRARMLAVQASSTALFLGALLGHVWMYGDPIGYPMPGPAMFFFPFVGAAVSITSGLVTLVFAVGFAAFSWWIARRKAPRSG
jgi:hypothetical protein